MNLSFEVMGILHIISYNDHNNYLNFTFLKDDVKIDTIQKNMPSVNLELVIVRLWRHHVW